MSAKTAVVAMGRYGDIINVLPCVRDIAMKEGGKCAVLVSAEFASVLDGCSYAEVVVVSDHFTDYIPAVEQAKRMFERVLVSKVNEKSVGVTTQCEAFNQEAWRQIGYLNEWFRLPLVFDRRDREREEKLTAETHGRREGRVVLVNCSGKSAPYPQPECLFNAPILIGENHRVIDLARIKAHRIYDLIGLFDDADLLITSDTSTLHLAAASGIPVVNLIGDQPTRWHGSRPRNNSVLEIRYSERKRLSEIWTVPLEWKPRTWQVWSDYAMSGDARRRHNLARRTWESTGWIPFPVRETPRVMNDPMRSMPFIKDLVEAAVNAAGPRDSMLLTNADTCVSAEAARRIEEVLGETPNTATGTVAIPGARHGAKCCYSFRRDFEVLPHGTMNTAQVREGKMYPGCDLFAFNVAWWREHGSRLPDLLLGTEGWDWCWRVAMQQTGGVEFDDLIYHERHENVWERAEHRHSLPSQQHNKRLAAPWLAGRGVVM